MISTSTRLSIILGKSFHLLLMSFSISLKALKIYITFPRFPVSPMMCTHPVGVAVASVMHRKQRPLSCMNALTEAMVMCECSQLLLPWRYLFLLLSCLKEQCLCPSNLVWTNLSCSFFSEQGLAIILSLEATTALFSWLFTLTYFQGKTSLA